MGTMFFHLLMFLDFMVLKLLYWNCCGVGSQRFRDILNDLIRLHRVDVVFITEPRISSSGVDEIAKKLSLRCIKRIEAIGRSGGLWMLARDGTIKFEFLNVGSHFIHMSLKGDGQTPTYCTTVDIHPQAARKN